MKKSLFFVAAASALMLTACSSESDVVQNTAPQTQTTVQQKAVGFDTYTAGTTRAGSPVGVMNTDKLKTADKGFGVFGFYQDNANYISTMTPNFMYNEHVHWTNAGGWTYAPLKYWPNETTKDSQDPAATAQDNHKDKLSFFAYAPYVEVNASPLTNHGPVGDGGSGFDAYYASSSETGITAISSETYAKDPLVKYAISSDPDNNVDLLWGVAPAGMSYTDVSGSTSGATAGLPLLNMVKPDKDQKMKFLFQHALSRIGLTVVSAIDQIAAGDDGKKYNTNETRVLIEEVKIWGNFGNKGVLNLNNGTANVANWIEASVDRTETTVDDPQFTINTANALLNPVLRYDASKFTGTGSIYDTPSKFADLNIGVLKSETDLMVGGPDPSKKVENSTPAYPYGGVLYKDNGSGDYVIATEPASSNCATYTKNANSDFTQVKAAGGDPITLDGTTTYYDLGTPASTTAAADIAIGDSPEHWTLTTDGTTGMNTYTHHAEKTRAITSGETYYTITETALAPTGNKYSSGTYYTGLLPRYFMVIPSTLPYVEGTTETTINVKITYRVVTKDTKLTGNVSNISNAITKETKIQLYNGKSYNLKLILGLTSVKLDATVADWQVADDTEIWLPKNND